MTDTPLRLAIVDDHHLVRGGFVRMMEQWPNSTVVVEADNGLDYEQKCAEAGHIHIVLIDLQMPIRDGYDTLRWVRRHQPRTLPIVITFDIDPLKAQLVVALGARGILLKNGTPKELLQALTDVYARGFHYNAVVDKGMHRKWEEEGEAKHPCAIWESMSPRERQFSLRYARPPFPSLFEMRAILGLKESGVESLRKQVVERTGCSRREEMMEFLRQAEVQGRLKP